MATRKKKTKTGPPATVPPPAPVEAPAPSPTPRVKENYTVRVRMYRQGLGDCFLLTFPRQEADPFSVLIDFGALNRGADAMIPFAKEIAATTKSAAFPNGSLDLIVMTHEHKDHLSGFNQARAVFDEMHIGGVWMGWTEDPENAEALDLDKGREEAAAQLRMALASPRFAAAGPEEHPLMNVNQILAFSDGDDTPLADRKTIRDAREFLRQCGLRAHLIRYLEPGEGPLALPGVEGVRVYVLGPPHGPRLTQSEVTKEHQADEVVYHLRRPGQSLLKTNLAALSATGTAASSAGVVDEYQPFAPEHRITRASIWWGAIQEYIQSTYDQPGQEWRQIDNEWLGAFDRLALKLASDTNNTSLVLAFEIVATREVLLFVGDAQVGNWLSWKDIEFEVPGLSKKVGGHDLLARTVFYKVGHHASHNATLKKGGLELMQSPKLVAFVPLDKATAAMQGKKDPITNKPKGWQMPAKALFEALLKKTEGRVVISDSKESLSPAAAAAGVKMTPTYFEFTI